MQQIKQMSTDPCKSAPSAKSSFYCPGPRTKSNSGKVSAFIQVYPRFFYYVTFHTVWRTEYCERSLDTNELVPGIKPLIMPSEIGIIYPAGRPLIWFRLHKNMIDPITPRLKNKVIPNCTQKSCCDASRQFRA